MNQNLRLRGVIQTSPMFGRVSTIRQERGKFVGDFHCIMIVKSAGGIVDSHPHVLDAEGDGDFL